LSTPSSAPGGGGKSRDGCTCPDWRAPTCGTAPTELSPILHIHACSINRLPGEMFPISHSFWPPPLVAQHLRLLFFFSFFCFVFFLFCIAFLFVGSLSSRLPIPRPLSFSFVAARRVSAAAVPFLSPLELNDRSSRRTLAVLDFHLTEFLPSFPSAALIQDLGILITFSTSDNDFIEPSDDTGEFIRPLFCKPFLTVYFSLASLLSSLTLVYSFLSLLY